MSQLPLTTTLDFRELSIGDYFLSLSIIWQKVTLSSRQAVGFIGSSSNWKTSLIGKIFETSDNCVVFKILYYG